MNRRTVRWAAGAAVAALLAAGCGSDPEETAGSAGDDTAATTMAGDGTTSTTAHADDGHHDAAAVDTPAADLRAGLTFLLQEHVYLAGATINQAVADGGDMEAPGTASAVGALDENSVALSEAVGSVYGAEAGDQFLALWRDHIGFFVDYTLAGAGGDTAAQEEARAKLDGYRQEFGAFVDSATGGELPADDVAADLQVHVDTLLVAVDDVLAGSPDVYPDLKAAAGHMPMTASALAGAIAAQQELEGDVASPASELRTGLTFLLGEHVYLAGLAINQAVADGGDMEAPGTASAVGALDENSVALSEAVGSVYGAEAGDQFLALWRDHIGFFVDYTLAGAGGDTAAQEEARAKLDGYRQEFGAFVDSATGGELPADDVAADLQVHVDTLLVAVDDVLAGSPDVYPDLKAAAGHMPMTASALAGAIAAQQELEGDVASPASELRTGLTFLLGEHVYLAGLAINQAVADGGDMEAPGTASAVGALDENSVALSEAVGSVYGAEAGDQFLALWRDHIGFFVDYTLAGAGGDTAAQEEARAELDGYRQEFGAFVDSATGGELPADDVAADLQVHVDTLLVAVDDVLAGSPDVYPDLKAAAGHMPMTASALAGAIAAQSPEGFEG